MKYWKLTRPDSFNFKPRYYQFDTLQGLMDDIGYYPENNFIYTEITKADYDLHFEKQRLIKLAETGQLNTMLTTYFNSIYRRANNLPDSFFTSLTIDGHTRTKKQVLNSISALAVDGKYLIAFEGTTGFIDLQTGQIEIYLKDIFAIEDNYRTNKNPEWERLVKILTVQEYIEEKFTKADSSILKLIHQLIQINLQGTSAVNQIPDVSGIDFGALVSGGTT